MLYEVITFFQKNKFKLASFEDLRKSFEKVSGKDMKIYFDQWLTRAGGPELRVSGVEAWPEGDRITSYNVCYTKLLRVMQNFMRVRGMENEGKANDFGSEEGKGRHAKPCLPEVFHQGKFLIWIRPNEFFVHCQVADRSLERNNFV